MLTRVIKRAIFPTIVLGLAATGDLPHALGNPGSHPQTLPHNSELTTIHVFTGPTVRVPYVKPARGTWMCGASCIRDVGTRSPSAK
jgi:hypothetical protein